MSNEGRKPPRPSGRQQPAAFGGSRRRASEGEENKERPEHTIRENAGARSSPPEYGSRPREGFGQGRGESGGYRPDRGPARSDSRGDFRDPRAPSRSGPRSESGYDSRPNSRGGSRAGPGSRPRPLGGENSLPSPLAKPSRAQITPHLNKDELRYHGKNACLALFKARPKDIIRVYVNRELTETFSELLEFCATTKKTYNIVADQDLERLTDTKHHDGVCVVAKERRSLTEAELVRELGPGRNLVLFLDGVGNPHNLGAILRTAAHFGVKYVAGDEQEMPRISPSANRTSEGGAEHVRLVRVESAERFFVKLKAQGFKIYAFDPGAKAVSLFDTPINDKAVFVMGAEVSGLSPMARKLADLQVKIPGNGVMESLNVSVATALAMAEFHRQGT